MRLRENSFLQFTSHATLACLFFFFLISHFDVHYCQTRYTHKSKEGEGSVPTLCFRVTVVYKSPISFVGVSFSFFPPFFLSVKDRNWNHR